MSTINIFQISFEIWGCIIGIIVCILMNAISFKEDNTGKKLWKMVLINNFILVSDALAYIYRGDTTLLGVIMTHVTNFSLFALEYIFIIMMVRYVKCLTDSRNGQMTEIWEYIAFTLIGASFVGLMVTQFTGFYYFFDNTNHYQRGNGIWINFASCIIVIVICAIKIWLSRKVLSRHVKTMLSICVIVFTVCIAVQIIFYGVSLLNIGLTVSLLIMYIGHYKEQYNLHMNNCIDEAIKDTQSILSYRPAKDSYSGKIQETKDETRKE